MKDIIKKVKTLDDFNLEIRGSRKTIEDEAEEQKRGFLVCY